MDLEKFKGNPLRTRKPEEYSIGTLYYIENEHNDTQFLLVKSEGVSDPDRIKGRYLSNFEDNWVFLNEISTPWVTNRPSRIATVDEVIWYTACIKADKFIPRENALLKPERVIPTEKSYIITEDQLKELYGNAFSPTGIRARLEEWYNMDMFHEKVGGNG